MNPSIVLALILIFAGVALLTIFLVRQRRDKLALEQRIDRTIGLPAFRTWHGDYALHLPSSFGRMGAMLRLVFTFGVRRLWGVRASTLLLALVGTAAAVAAWLLAHTLLQLAAWIAITGALAAFLVAPRALISWEQRRADAQFTAIFPDAIDTLVRVLRAGLPVSAGIRAVAADLPRPVSTLFVKIVNETEIGIALEELLAAVVERVGLPDFNFFVTAVSLQSSTGGNLAQTLETLGEIIRKRRGMRLKAWAATSEVRMSAIVLSAIPFFVFGAFTLASPSYIDQLISDPRGNIIIGTALLLLLLAGATMRWMVRRNTAM